MNIEQFKATRKEMSGKEFGELVGDSMFDDIEASVIVYDNRLYIEKLPDNRHMLTIYNESWIEPDTTLETMESILWSYRYFELGNSVPDLLSVNDGTLDAYVFAYCHWNNDGLINVNGDAFGLAFSGSETYTPDIAQDIIEQTAKIYNLRAES